MGIYATDKDCQYQRDYLGITEWQKYYKGKGLNIFCNDVGGSHVESTSDILRVNLPEANVYTGGFYTCESNGKVESFTVHCKELNIESMDLDEFLQKHDISLMNDSTGIDNGTDMSKVDTPSELYLRERLKKYNIIMTSSAGNGGDGHIQSKFCDTAIMVNSAKLKNGYPVHVLSSIGEKIDFCMLMGFFSGTSYASPMLLSLIGFLRCKYGRQLTKEQAYEYLTKHCVDVDTQGKDVRTGWGVPRLGTLKKEIKLTVGSKVMSVDGMKIPLDQAPIQTKDTYRMLVPVRAITESLGAEVVWDEKTRTATFTFDGINV